jgi:hypothetical protein
VLLVVSLVMKLENLLLFTTLFCYYYGSIMTHKYRGLIHLKCIYNFLCYMLVYTPFALCFVTLRGVFMHFLELTY